MPCTTHRLVLVEGTGRKTRSTDASSTPDVSRTHLHTHTRQQGGTTDAIDTRFSLCDLHDSVCHWQQVGQFFLELVFVASH